MSKTKKSRVKAKKPERQTKPLLLAGNSLKLFNNLLANAAGHKGESPDTAQELSAKKAAFLERQAARNNRISEVMENLSHLENRVDLITDSTPPSEVEEILAELVSED